MTLPSSKVAVGLPVVESARVPGIVVAYTVVFFGALPALLWELGARFDVGLRLAPLEAPAWSVLGWMLVIFGAGWMILSMARLRWPGGGWPISHLPPRFLVWRGPYEWMRHPVYVGYSAALAGAGLGFGSLGRGLLAPALLTIGWITYAIGFEEPRLRARFGEGYAAYARRTPLFPFPLASPLLRGGLRTWLAARPAVEIVANHTVLFRVGGSVWVTYGALVAFGTLVACVWNAALLKAWGLSAGDIAVYQLGMAFSMIAGGRLAWLGYEWRAVARDPNIIVRRVGFVSFGGYLGLIVFTVAFSRLVKVDVLGFFDRTVPVAFVISAFGRLGCLSYGCCYGRLGAHGVRWTAPAAKVNRERGEVGRCPRVPTQLLLCGLAIVASAAGFAALVHGAQPGAAAASAALVYATLRFGVEQLRDEPRFSRWRLTRGQLVAVPIAVGVIAFWLGMPHGAAVESASTPLDSLAVVALWPAMLAVCAIVFAACSYHRKEVGRW